MEKESKEIMVAAHAGCMNTQLDSLSSIEVALKYPISIVELDVRFFKNGCPVLSHDPIDEDKSDYISLDEALKVLSPYKQVSVNLDMKELSEISIIKRLLEKYDMMERSFLTGIEFKQMENVKHIGIPYYVNFHLDDLKYQDADYVRNIRDEICSTDALGINLNYKEVTPMLIDLFHESGRLVSVWTVDEETEMNRLIKLGVDSITTNEIEILLNKLKKREYKIA